MNTREALLRGISENPDDEAAKLVYADFLEESGNEADVARARLIRMGVRWSPELSGGETEELLTETHSLWDQYRKQWLRGLPAWLAKSQPAWGFIDEVYCTPKQFLKDGQAILAREPLVHLLLKPGKAGDMAALANAPFLSRIRQTTILSDEISNQDLEIFLRSPHLTDLRQLCWLRDECPLELISLIANEPKFSSIRDLNFNYQQIGVEGVRELTKSKTLVNVGSLGLSREACDESAQLLARSILVQKLKTLEFSGNLDQEALTKKGLQALTRCSDLAQLEFIDLCETSIGDKGLSAFKEDRPWPNLRNLLLSKNQITDRGLRSLSRAPFTKLEALHLDGNPIQGKGIASILEAFTDQQLKILDLGQCKINDAGLLAIAKTGASPPLRELWLQDNSFGEGFKDIILSPMVRELQHLNLSENPICDEGGVAIGESPYLRNLDSLYLESCWLSDKTLIALGKSPNLAKLWRLTINGNHFTTEGIRALAQSPYLTKVSEVNITHAGLQDESSYALAESPYLNPYRSLYLAGNSFSKKATRALKNRYKMVSI